MDGKEHAGNCGFNAVLLLCSCLAYQESNEV